MALRATAVPTLIAFSVMTAHGVTAFDSVIGGLIAGVLGAGLMFPAALAAAAMNRGTILAGVIGGVATHAAWVWLSAYVLKVDVVTAIAAVALFGSLGLMLGGALVMAFGRFTRLS